MRIQRCGMTAVTMPSPQLPPNTNPYDAYSARSCCNAPIESLKWILKQQSAPSETAAILIEPIQGEGGFLTPPPSFLPALRKICDEHGIMLIIDEVPPSQHMVCGFPVHCSCLDEARRTSRQFDTHSLSLTTQLLLVWHCVTAITLDNITCAILLHTSTGLICVKGWGHMAAARQSPFRALT